MSCPDIPSYEDEFNEIKQIVGGLHRDTQARAVLLLDPESAGTLASAGDAWADLESLTGGRLTLSAAYGRLEGTTILPGDAEGACFVAIGRGGGRLILAIEPSTRTDPVAFPGRVDAARARLEGVVERIREKVQREPW